MGDPDGRAVYVNPAFERDFKVSKSRLSGAPLAGLFEGGAREAVLAAVAGVFRGSPRERFRLREGGKGFEAMASPVEVEGGRVGVVILLTPVLIKAFTRQGFGQEIRVEGPQSHQAKRGTPTMGGVAILAGLWAGYWGSHLIGLGYDAEGPTASGLLVLGLTTALGGVGFLDDFIKIRKQRNLGLNKTAKLVGEYQQKLRRIKERDRERDAVRRPNQHHLQLPPRAAPPSRPDPS